MVSVTQFSVGDTFINIEQSINRSRLQIMSIWMDEKDDEVYYICKCIGIADQRRDIDMVFKAPYPWQYFNDVNLYTYHYLNKYYCLEG